MSFDVIETMRWRERPELEISEGSVSDFRFSSATDFFDRVRWREELFDQIFAARRLPPQRDCNRLERMSVAQPQAIVLRVAGTLEFEFGKARGRFILSRGRSHGDRAQQKKCTHRGCNWQRPGKIHRLPRFP